ncbi:dynamin-like GTPase family protein [Pseudomonas sp. PDM12]|uniref:dynamin-like GTPase family protein n=1 Tax=Pseudomonas sp. PDM12 TaxID=2769260 RepID=UPI0017804034|nr:MULTISPECIES: dynamin-like GTPase family protein [unclassified Pseudomonas]MBD9653288.1 dynamin-like GTPase family protein [Pseudomonas sp. PDM12]
MSMERLSEQVDAYVAWKRELVREITRYRSWLAHNRLSSEGVEARLERALRLLRTDHITLAFVGEFSRGKTELINSLFFSEYGQRLLPSQAGRTTMCPTEILYDPGAEQPYIRLLPIETRIAEASVAQFKRTPRHWVNITLDTRDPDSMAKAFAQVAASKAMPVEKAISLGFHPDNLESTDKSGQVLVPAWRHAIVNFDHPLLRQGLRILDTPGLNALGCEPELTLSMLPSAQAVIFLLSADTGVTASDLDIWQQHVQPLDEERQGCLYAVLNKIDVLWDDLAGETFVTNAIERVRMQAARHLGIAGRDILPLSAKQALLAKVRKDPALLARSQMAELETLLCERIVAQKEQLLEERVVRQALAMLNNSQHVLGLRLAKVNEQLQLLDGRRQDNGQMLMELTSRTKDDHTLHHKRLVALRTNQRLLRNQGERLKTSAQAEKLEAHLAQLRRQLNGAWTTLGINQSILNFFTAVEDDLHSLAHDADMANRMVEAIYRRHNEENPLQAVDAPRFELADYVRELRHLQKKADRFRLGLKALLTEQRSLGRRFFATLVQEVIGLHRRLRRDAERWADEALMPLMQHSLEHKQLLEGHMLRLKALAQDTQHGRQRHQQLAQYAEELKGQLAQAGDMLRVMRRPAPIQRQAKVVTLKGMPRPVGNAE